MPGMVNSLMGQIRSYRTNSLSVQYISYLVFIEAGLQRNDFVDQVPRSSLNARPSVKRRDIDIISIKNISISNQ